MTGILIDKSTEEKMQELELIAKAVSGDQKAFCGVYDLYKDRLFRYAFYRLGNRQDAEDAVSECVLSMWKQLGSLRKPEAFAAWAFRILAACCAKMIKKQIDDRNTISLDDYRVDAAASETASGGSGPKNADTALALREALECLSEEERNIVLLSVVGGLKSGEIAENTGMTPGSVRSSLSRSLKKVRGYLE